MSKKLPAVTLTILNKEYKIVCPPEEQAALCHTAKLLDEKMRRLHDSGKVTGTDRIAVMAALNLTQELELTKPVDQNDQSVTEKIINLRKKIETALKN
jgi:cell division protein ZapA